MRILMVTNTFAPHVGGVARSVTAFTHEYRRRRHDVLVIAPEFSGAPAQEEGVLRVRALQNFNGSDFSVVLKPTGRLRRVVETFAPDLIHSHHPFLLGSTALRLARSLRVPLAFTHHTMYERYTHYVPGDSPALKRFVERLSTNYANLCAHVFAPSASTSTTLRERQVDVPIEVLPTGVRLGDYDCGNGAGLRSALGVPDKAFVVGYVGRLAEEKNLPFLARAFVRFLQQQPQACALIVGDGALRNGLQQAFGEAGLQERVRFTGMLQGALLVSAYKAMDVFAFASQTETQGMVLVEAMAAGVPVVALDASGAREVVVDGTNGRLLVAADENAFCDGIQSVRANIPTLRPGALRTAQDWALERCADRALARYEQLLAQPAHAPLAMDEAWYRTARLLRAEWDLLGAAMGAASKALQGRLRLPAADAG